MVKINLYPESDLADFAKAVSEFQKIWQEDGERIISKWQEITGLTFRERNINAVIANGIKI